MVVGSLRTLAGRVRMAISANASARAGKPSMIAIRIPKSQWGRAWRAMVEIAPVRLVANDPIYEVLPAHLEMLSGRGFTYKIIRPAGAATREKRRAAGG